MVSVSKMKHVWHDKLFAELCELIMLAAGDREDILAAFKSGYELFEAWSICRLDKKFLPSTE